MPSYLAQRRGAVVRTFTCRRCGARGDVEFEAVGVGGARRLFDDDGAMLAAGDDAEVQQRRDAEKALALFRCPSCHNRPRGALVWPGVRIAALSAVGVAVGLAGLAPMWAVAAPLGAVALAVELRRVRRVDKATTVKLVPGKPVPVELPAAHVVRAPPPADRVRTVTPAPAVAPPPQPPPPEPGAEPSLLGSDD